MTSALKATLYALLTVAVVLLPTVAHADGVTDTTYDVSGTFASGGTLSGWFTLENGEWMPSPIITAGTITADGDTFSCPGSYSNGCVIGSGGTVDFEFLTGPGQDGSLLLFLAWPGNEVTTFTFDATRTFCEGCVAGIWDDYLVSGGGIDPPYPPDGDSAAAPEPSSAGLLFLGVAGLCFVSLKNRTANTKA